MKYLVPCFFFFALALLCVHVESKQGQSRANRSAGADPAAYVNAFVGTAGTYDSGITYPGAARPFGMIQWSPETTNGFIKHAEGYIYSDEGIRGFSLTHLSSPGCFGDVPIQPVVGGVTSSPATNAATYLAKFSHSNEEASPGFYAVGFDNGAKVQLTVTARAGIGNFTFPASTGSAIIFNVGSGATRVENATVDITGDRRIAGTVYNGSMCGIPLCKYTVYFAAEFSRPFNSFGTWKGSDVNKGQRTVAGTDTGGFVGFDTTTDHTVRMKIAMSYVSAANAWKNLNKEIPGWDFDAVRRSAHARWNRDLSRISVSGGTEDEQRVFYTALYHTLLHPNTFNDVNGEYIGFDDKVHLASGFTMYANISGWDIYRGEVQLLAMLFPREASDIVQSLLMDEQQGGGLPIWPATNNEGCQMVANPSCPIIASVYAFGARSFDTKGALKAMLRGATNPIAKSKSCPEWDDLEGYLERGYVGPDSRIGSVYGSWRDYSGPTHMLELTTADFSIAQFAKAIGDNATYRIFMRRAQFWKNTFNTKTGYIAPRLRNGSFVPVDPGLRHFRFDGRIGQYVEGNATQYTWMVPYNMQGLFELMGGNAKAVARLDDFFTELNAGENRPYCYIGNEPSFLVPWAYDYAGAPWRAQAVTRRVETELFTLKPDGLPGNDDLGAMSAWYVFAALGIYPAIPGVGGMALNSPLFQTATIQLGNGNVITIEGDNAAASNPYVQSLTVNGKLSESTWIPYSTLSQGANVHFELADSPNKEWGTKPEDAPPSFR